MYSAISLLFADICVNRADFAFLIAGLGIFWVNPITLDDGRNLSKAGSEMGTLSTPINNVGSGRPNSLLA